ncbi:hypothetical protein [Paenibacillus sinopodophylli]|uniref:hypothetical protein n=1 Tax=Paenibacillus sinopodophylli TaxID=1837342 RepID=UPI00110D1B91|nr:hypothetical protein [Paenibacillus sinopodophylli]
MSRASGKWNVWSITFLALLVIGLANTVVSNPLTFIIPIVILGGIFWLYKYPPSFLRNNSAQHGRTQVTQSRATAAKTKAKKPRSSKTVPFRVIEGGKDDDDLPKYH